VRLLLDTVALIFAVESPERLTKRATGILQNTENILELMRDFSFRNRHHSSPRQVEMFCR
jgi:hypothetical protein